jgi:hypothetical protein
MTILLHICFGLPVAEASHDSLVATRDEILHSGVVIGELEQKPWYLWLLNQRQMNVRRRNFLKHFYDYRLPLTIDNNCPISRTKHDPK